MSEYLTIAALYCPNCKELRAENERLTELPNELVDWLKSARHKDARGHYVNWVDVLRGLAAIKYGISLGVKND